MIKKRINGINVYIFPNKRLASIFAARIVNGAVERRKDLVLGLATGRTMISFYRALVRLSRRDGVDFSKVKTFNLDEYVGLSSGNKKSFRSFMDKNLFSKTNLDNKNINFLNGVARSLKKECEGYESKLRKNRIDLQILGIGINGHIGFNEPGSKASSKTRRVELTESTRLANKSEFTSIGKVPTEALTMGIGSIMRARKVLLLAFGSSKANAVAHALKDKASEKVPASILRKHRDVVFITDDKSAVKL